MNIAPKYRKIFYVAVAVLCVLLPTLMVLDIITKEDIDLWMIYFGFVVGAVQSLMARKYLNVQ